VYYCRGFGGCARTECTRCQPRGCVMIRGNAQCIIAAGSADAHGLNARIASRADPR
jgi:hypothetical protein